MALVSHTLLSFNDRVGNPVVAGVTYDEVTLVIHEVWARGKSGRAKAAVLEPFSRQRIEHAIDSDVQKTTLTTLRDWKMREVVEPEGRSLLPPFVLQGIL